MPPGDVGSDEPMAAIVAAGVSGLLTLVLLRKARPDQDDDAA
jgi:hypothetical protein